MSWCGDGVAQIIHDFLQGRNGLPDARGRLGGGAEVALGIVERQVVECDAMAMQFGRKAGLARAQHLAGLLVGVFGQMAPL